MTDPIGSEAEGTEIYKGAFGGAHLCVNDPCDDARHWPEAAVRLFNHLRADLEAARAENKRVEAVIERCDREMDALNSALIERDAELAQAQDRIAALERVAEAASQEHGPGPYLEPECPLCVALAAIDAQEQG